MRNRYNSMKRIQKYQVRYSSATARATKWCRSSLAASCSMPRPSEIKQFYEIPYARHNDTPPPSYYAALSEFLDRVDEAASDTCHAVRRRQAAAWCRSTFRPGGAAPPSAAYAVPDRPCGFAVMADSGISSRHAT